MFMTVGWKIRVLYFLMSPRDWNKHFAPNPNAEYPYPRTGLMPTW